MTEKPCSSQSTDQIQSTMFRTTRALWSGLLWKKTKWNRLRKANAKKQRKRVDSVLDELRKPYTSSHEAVSNESGAALATKVMPVSEAAKVLTFQQIMQRVNANQLDSKRIEAVNEAFNTSKRKQ